MAQAPKKRKYKLKFRGEIVFLSFLLSFILCFIAYVNGVKEQENAATPVINSNVSNSNEIIDISKSSSDKKDSEKSEEKPQDNSVQAENNEVVQDGNENITVENNSIAEEITEQGNELPDVQEEQPQQNNSSTGSNPVAQSSKQDESYLDTCIFVGDSISTGFSGYGFVSEKNVFAKTSMRIDLINNTPLKTFYGDVLVSKAIKAAAPQNVYVMLGSNGMGWIDTSKMISDYSTFIDSVKAEAPDVTIYVMSIPPVTAEREQKPSVEEGKILNSDITEYNNQLLSLANEKGVHFIDVNSALVNSQGKLPSDVSTDGMHFNKETYIKVIDYILTHVAG